MADEDLSLVPESVQPATPQTSDNQPDADLADSQQIGEGSDPASPGNEPDDELEEFEWSGQTIRGPKGLKDGMLMHADYTRKTQEVSARNKELDARERQIVQQAKSSEEELTARAKLIGFDNEIQQYAQVNWDALEAEDPVGAHQHWRRFQQLKENRQQVAMDLHQRQQTRTQEAQRDYAKRIEETQAFAKSLPGWSPEVDAQVIEFARQHGASDDALRDAMSPLVYKMLHLARLGEQAMKRQSSTPKPTPANIKPLTVVAAKTNAPAKKSIGEMSMEEHAALFRKQKAQGAA